MKVTKIDIWEQPLLLREPLVYSHHTVDSVVNIGFRIHLSDGLTGLGFAAPETEVSGETPESVLELTKSQIEPAFLGAQTGRFSELSGQIQQKHPKATAAQAMLDMAIHDYIAKKAQAPLFKVLGATRNEIPTSVTIYIHNVEETLRRAERMLNEGYSILKIKGGIDLDEDIARLNALGAKFPTVPIIWDVNQGYSESDYKKFCSGTNHPNLVAVEQPIRKSKRKLICDLSQSLSTPIMIDESLSSRDDAKYFSANGVKYFNIKLMKSGGIRQSIEIAQIGARKGVQSIYSCMDECAYVNAAGLHAALASSGVSFVDLDSFTDYKVDPTRSSIMVRDGVLSVGASVGIGYFQED